MRKNTHETSLPSALDLAKAPPVNPKTAQNTSDFLENTRKVIGYPIEAVDFDTLFGETSHPIFDASFIDYDNLPYADYLSYIYNFYFERNRLREAKDTLEEYQALLLCKYGYIFLMMNIAGYVDTLHNLHAYLELRAKEFGMIYSGKKIKITKDLPITISPHISEPHLLKSTFIFSE